MACQKWRICGRCAPPFVHRFCMMIRPRRVSPEMHSQVLDRAMGLQALLAALKLCAAGALNARILRAEGHNCRFAHVHSSSPPEAVRANYIDDPLHTLRCRRKACKVVGIRLVRQQPPPLSTAHREPALPTQGCQVVQQRVHKHSGQNGDIGQPCATPRSTGKGSEKAPSTLVTLNGVA
jgi:hypothetical protein